ncbi:BMP family ABC transporter substrate-binding protein [Streptomyces sp. UNOC14_S4]|uniref:BMP family ABC transporter substrate-binding protein n=1 Tax=Streptomyces sp. UNOC14_S4 TaxID=2872340 RepID=UPI001E30C440|nr:BMP family ABC transporter substrate-binding protein [Streptomyces sp. UNOC14_S4]MCC3770468.1 BMP family ABC transporter substrate-binding protein [Streptomyces sp. UNOC14_S4]
MRRRSWVAAGAGAVVLTGGLIAAIVLSGGGDGGQEPRARQYTDHSACLLTDGRGVTGDEAAPVWAGMEDASLATHAKVTSLPVFGPDTVANAVPYVNTLVQRRCDIVLAVGRTPGAATEEVAARTPAARFVVVGDGRKSGNVTVIQQSRDTRSAVARAVKDAVHK